ncbi:glycogen/starch synthase, partial [Klebsiella pneumoniae]
MEQFNVWFTVSEVQGLVKSGGLADVAKALPQALKALHQQVAIALPAYRSVPGKEDAELVLETELTHWPHTQYRVLKRDLDGVP